MKVVVLGCLFVLALAFAGCPSTNSGAYRDFSSSNQRRASGSADQNAASRHDSGASESNTTSASEEAEQDSGNPPQDPHSKVHVVQEAGEKETRTGMVTERVENRPSSKPTPTPTDDMNKPLDPIGRPLTAPTP